MKQPTHYQVHEMFSSFQGEGVMTGSPATFIRLQGCNVGCSWCDAKRTWGPVLETTEYLVGYQSAVSIGYTALGNGRNDGEHFRGIIAALFDNRVFVETDYFMFVGPTGDEPYNGNILEEQLSRQDLHPFRTLTGNVAVRREQWQVFIDYFRPLKAEFYLGIKRRKTGEKLSLEDIAGFVHDARNAHIVVTGGEPLLWNLDPLFDKLREVVPDVLIQLETSGQGGFKGRKLPDFITWSPKANLKYDAPFDFKKFVSEVKFVVDEYLPLEVVEETWAWYRKLRNIGDQTLLMPTFVMMPEGCPPSQEAINRALQFARAGGSRMWRVGARLQYSYGVR